MLHRLVLNHTLNLVFALGDLVSWVVDGANTPGPHVRRDRHRFRRNLGLLRRSTVSFARPPPCVERDDDLAPLAEEPGRDQFRQCARTHRDEDRLAGDQKTIVKSMLTKYLSCCLPDSPCDRRRRQDKDGCSIRSLLYVPQQPAALSLFQYPAHQSIKASMNDLGERRLLSRAYRSREAGVKRT